MTAMAGRLAAIAALCFVAALQLHRLDDSDTWWHLASGRRIAERGEVDRVDPFSYTAAGAEWINRQWLFDVGAFASWRAGGELGLTLVAGAGYFAGFLSLYVLVRRRLPIWAAAVLVMLAAQAAVERFTVRPEAATMALLGVYLLVLDGPWRPLRMAALVALQALWANLHALSVLGLIPLATAWAAAAASHFLLLPAGWRLQRDGRELRALGFAMVGAALAEAATPFGLRGALFPLRLLTVIRGGEATSPSIVEHLPPTLATLSPVAAFGLVSLLVLATIAAAASWRHLRLDHAALAIAFAALALLARRNVALVGFGQLPLVASGLASSAWALDRRLRRRPAVAAAAELALAAVLAVPTVRMITGDWYRSTAHLTRTFGFGRSELLFSRGAADWLEQHAPAARVFNDDGLGGWLLWRSFPPRRVFVDGRLQVYPADVFEEYMSVLDDPGAFAALAASRGVTAAILSHPAPGRLELAGAIARLPGWRVGYLDAGTIVLVADGQPPGDPDGVRAPVVETDAAGVAGALDGALSRVRTPVEAAVSHYQRGRAIAYLYGASGAALAADDFRAALRLFPGYQPAAGGLRALGTS